MNELGDYLKQLRGKRSLREMQKVTGVSHTYLKTIENGINPRNKKMRHPSPEILRKLAKTLDVPYLLLLEKAGYLEEDETE